MKFKDKLKEERLKKGLKQADVAAEIGISKQAFSRYEVGTSEPTMIALITIADLFNISIDELVCRNTFKFNSDLGLEEIELLSKFNNLSREDQQKLMAIADTLQSLDTGQKSEKGSETA